MYILFLKNPHTQGFIKSKRWICFLIVTKDKYIIK